MYSYGASARATGKRGHGGRNYRPPPERNKNSGELTPPPMKACNCLLQLDLPEYLQAARRDVNGSNRPRRLHTWFPGNSVDERRKAVGRCEKHIRSRFGVHLVIPGRTQSSSVAIVGKSYHETIPAVAWFL